MINDVQLYHVVYRPGWSGSWLTWFINQHSGFPQYEYRMLHNGAQNTDYECPGADWYIDTQSIVDNMEARHSLASSEYNKRCFKVIPDHEFISDDNESIDRFKTLLKPQIPAYRSIMLEVTNDEHFYRFARRYQPMLLSETGENYTVEEMIDQFKNEARSIRLGERYSMITDYAETFLFLNIGKLIFDLDEAEYNKLIAYLGTTPLADWKDKVSTMIETVYDR